MLDLSGNVWEWTRSLWGKELGKPAFQYPYKADDGRENLNAPGEILRVLRSGSFIGDRGLARCAHRGAGFPDLGVDSVCFRVVVSLYSP